MESSAPSLSAIAVLRGIGVALIAVALPVLLVTSAVRWTALDAGFYMQGFAKYRVGYVTGLSAEQLQTVADAFAQYFQSPPGPLDIVMDLPAGRQALFNAREIHHMEDVQLLMHRVFQIWIGAMLVLVVAMVAIIAPQPATAAPWAFGSLATGGLLTILLIATIGLVAAIDFNAIFWRFHLVSFTNDLWLLDPARDRLIQLYPLGFFFDSAMRIAISSALAGAIIAAGSVIGLLRFR